MVVLNSQTLALEHQGFYVTDENNGSGQFEETTVSKALADDLAGAAGTGGRALVLLQSFGQSDANPKFATWPAGGGRDFFPAPIGAGWMAAAAAIGKLGGTPQVFVQLNQGSTDEPYHGNYAFVGRAAMDTSAAESSQPLTGSGGKLHGLLARGLDDQYEPLAADPSGTINFQLVQIVNRPSPPGGGFPAFTAGQEAAAAALGRDIGVCAKDAPTCDVRKAYYERIFGTDWSTIYTTLTDEKCDAGGTGFTPADCVKARDELKAEIKARNAVEGYFIGPKSLQAPFLGSGQVAALVDIKSITDQISATLKPLAADNAIARTLTIISDVVKVGAFAPAPASNASAGVSAAFALAAYLTTDNGSPDLLAEITTRSDQLATALVDRYQHASDYFTTEAKIVMSDWSKMQEVAGAITSDPWRLDDISTSLAQLRLATKQAIYQALLPVVYPVLYDLGTGVGDARSWVCRGGGLLVDKRLFHNTGPGAQMTWPVLSPSGEVQSHIIAVGGRHAVAHLTSAFIPSPPDTLTAPLFKDSSQGGVGLYRLQFYSPQNFHLFPQVLQQTERGTPRENGYWTCGSMPDPPGNSG
jgi:hypothetical protein